MALFLDGSNTEFIASVSVGKPAVNKSGGKSIALYNSPARTTLRLSTPAMMTWGVVRNEFEAGKATYSMSLQFPSPEYTTPEISAFLENIKALERLVLEKACEQSMQWFGKKQSPEIVKAFFNPLLYYSKDKATGEPDYTKSPTLRLKLPFYDGEFKTEFYNASHELIFPQGNVDITSVVTKGSDVDTLLMASIWMAGGKFGITLKPIEVRVLRAKQQLERGTCHLRPVATMNLPKPDPSMAVESASTEPLVESDEDPDDEYMAPTESNVEASDSVPEVPVKGKKKVVKKGEKSV
jgi:hypothetical protein